MVYGEDKVTYQLHTTEQQTALCELQQIRTLRYAQCD